jgi:hypothetical protein
MNTKDLNGKLLNVFKDCPYKDKQHLISGIVSDVNFETALISLIPAIAFYELLKLII